MLEVARIVVPDVLPYHLTQRDILEVPAISLCGSER